MRRPILSCARLWHRLDSECRWQKARTRAAPDDHGPEESGRGFTDLGPTIEARCAVPEAVAVPAGHVVTRFLSLPHSGKTSPERWAGWSFQPQLTECRRRSHAPRQRRLGQPSPTSGDILFVTAQVCVTAVVVVSAVRYVRSRKQIGWSTAADTSDPGVFRPCRTGRPAVGNGGSLPSTMNHKPSTSPPSAAIGEISSGGVAGCRQVYRCCVTAASWRSHYGKLSRYWRGVCRQVVEHPHVCMTAAVDSRLPSEMSGQGSKSAGYRRRQL